MSDHNTSKEYVELLPRFPNSEVQTVENPANVCERDDIRVHVNERDDPINPKDLAKKKKTLFESVISANLIQFRELIKDHHLLRNLTTILNNEGLNLIHIATIYNHVNILTEVLQIAKATEGIDIRQFVEAKCDLGRTALDQAIRNKNLKAVECLLQYGATLDIGTMCKAVIESTILPDKMFAQELIKMCDMHICDDNVRLDMNDRNVKLQVAALSSDWEEVKSLVEANIGDINSTRHGYPILQHAVRQQNLEMITWLIEHGANINGKDRLGRFLIQYAYEFEFDVLLHLLNHGILANTSVWSELTINNHISSHLLHTHLDNCIKEHKRDRRILYIDFKTLLPTPTGSECLPESEIDITYYISKNKELRGLLKHPVIRTFLMLKWSKVRWIYYTNFIFFISLCVILLIYIFFYYNKHTYNIYIYCLLVVYFILLLIREIFQMRIKYKKYFTSIENYVEIGLIFAMLLIILYSKTTDYKFRKNVSAASFICMSFSLTLLLGQHPLIAANIIMLRTVTYNFFIYFLSYLAILMSFGLSFFILFSHEDIDAEDDTDNINFFRNPFMTLFKALVMMTGELDAGGMNNNQVTWFSITILTLFIFMIPIIILNLLNGLAVSDTQRIRDEAEILGYVSQIEFIFYIERLFRTDTFFPILSNVMLFHSKKTESKNIFLYSGKGENKEFYKKCQIKSFINDVVAEAHSILLKKREHERVNEKKKSYRAENGKRV